MELVDKDDPEQDCYAINTKFYNHLKNAFDGVTLVWSISPMRVWGQALTEVLERFQEFVSDAGKVILQESIAKLKNVDEEYKMEDYEKKVAEQIFQPAMFDFKRLISEREEEYTKFLSATDNVVVDFKGESDDTKLTEMWAKVEEAMVDIVKGQPYDCEARTFTTDAQRRERGHAALTLNWKHHAPNLISAKKHHQTFSTIVTQLLHHDDQSVKWVLYITGMLLNILGGGFLLIDMCMSLFLLECSKFNAKEVEKFFSLMPYFCRARVLKIFPG